MNLIRRLICWRKGHRWYKEWDDGVTFSLCSRCYQEGARLSSGRQEAEGFPEPKEVTP